MLAAVLFVWACSSDTQPDGSTVEVGSITIDTGSVLLERGTHKTFTATVRDPKGQKITVPVVWRSSAESVAVFDVNGRLLAVDTGVTGVTASSLGVTSAAVGVRVVWQGAAHLAPFQFTAPSAATPGGTVGGDSIRVLVTNLQGSPVNGAQVTFAVTAGQGTISPTKVTTSVNGIAATQWILGPNTGANSVTATVVDSSGARVTWVTSNPTIFSVTSFNALTASQGDNQTGQILSALPVAPRVKLVDSTGKPRPGVPVTFTASANGKVTTVVASTGADGVASPGTWTLGDAPGTQTLTARVESAVITLHATATGTPILLLADQVLAGGFATCALLNDGTAKCWGQGGQVGDSTTTNRSVPTRIAGGITFKTMGRGTSHFCGIDAQGAIYCWGVNALVDTTGKTVSVPAPTKLASDRVWSQVTAGFGFNCAVAADQTTWCWGDNTFGQLGTGNFPKSNDSTTSFVPKAVSGGFNFTSLATGTAHTCALIAGGSAFCWGANQAGQLGDGTTVNRAAPTIVSGGTAFQAIGAGDTWSCGLSTAGQVSCWGNVPGQPAPQATPFAYQNTPVFTSLSVGGAHACALTGDGTAYCWGANNGGQVGDSTTTPRNAPVPVKTTMRFKAISAGFTHTCGLTTDGAVACWGLNRAGEVGDSTITFQPTPRFIVLGVNP